MKAEAALSRATAMWHPVLVPAPVGPSGLPQDKAHHTDPHDAAVYSDPGHMASQRPLQSPQKDGAGSLVPFRGGKGSR